MPHRIYHSIIWLCGALFGILPLSHQHSYGVSQVSPYLGDGFLGHHALIGIGLAAIGASLWGGFSNWICSSSKSSFASSPWIFATLTLQGALILLGIFHVVSDFTYLLAAGLGILVIGASHAISKGKTQGASAAKMAWRWLSRKRSWNWPFFLAIAAWLVWHNVQLINGMHGLDAAHKTSLTISRIATQLAATGTLYFALQLAIDTGPRWAKPSLWSLVSITPAFVIADQIFHVYWNQTFIGFINQFGTQGLLNLNAELKGGGVALGVWAVVGGFLALLAVLSLATYIASLFAKKSQHTFAPIGLIVIALIGTGIASVEQAIGKNWKDHRNWKQEYQEFGLHLSKVRPPSGLAHFDVTHKNYQWLEAEQELKLQRQPHIFIVFIESLRQDALLPEITPFLHRFAREEAQPIDQTWAASNGTHLSWFSTLSGLTPLARESHRDRARTENWPGLNSFHLLDKAGYDLHIHTAKSLAYRDMGRQLVGIENSAFQSIRQDEVGDPMHGLSYPEKEVLVFDGLKELLANKTQGPQFVISTIDSPHFQYSWHPDFTPPFPDFYPHKVFPATPTNEEIRLIKNQYFNALAWGDSLAERFCNDLKNLGCYDESIVVFMGDHGEEFQDHGGWLHVSSLEDEQVLSPMLIKWPKSYGRGPAHTEASNIDLLPSIIHYLEGKPSQAEHPGFSLLNNDPERSHIVATAQGGVTEEGLLITRNGYKAYFTWPQYFTGRSGSTLTLTRLKGPNGDILCKSPAEYHHELQKLFPDALVRNFTRFELQQVASEE